MSARAVRSTIDQAADGYADCPAGHLFQLYYPGWQAQDWKPVKEEKVAALKKCTGLRAAKDLLEAIVTRQDVSAETLPAGNCLVIDAASTSPFATGLGIEHPIENGFAFLAPYGLPYLAGSGVKGVLRRAAEQLVDGRVLDSAVVGSLFGPEAIGESADARRGALTCWDVFPRPPRDELTVEVMTPHYSDYYQGTATPHDSGKPNPIPFLAVPAGSRFRFVLLCHQGLVGDVIPGDEWKAIAGRIIAHAFDWLGFGAKTSVGYGVLVRDEEASKRREAVATERARKAATLAKSPNLQRVDAFIEKAERRHAELRGGKVKVNDAFMNEVRNLTNDAHQPDSWSAAEKRAVAVAVKEWLPKIFDADMKELRKKLKLAALEGVA